MPLAAGHGQELVILPLEDDEDLVRRVLQTEQGQTSVRKEFCVVWGHVWYFGDRALSRLAA